MLSPVSKYVATWLLYLVKKNYNRGKWNDAQGLLRKGRCFFYSMDGIYKTSRPSDKNNITKALKSLFIHHIITVSSDSHCLIKISCRSKGDRFIYLT